MRRRILALTTGVAVAASLAACAASPSGAEDASAATRTVSTATGKVTVPEHPLRVVSVHSWTTESLFDLGVKPVGVEDSGEQYVPKRYLSRWKAVPKVASGADIDFEKIASLKPDLIVGADVPYLHKAYAKLKAIAPTVFAPFTDDTTWQTYPTYTASFVGKTAELKTLKAKYDSAIAEVRNKYTDQLATLKWDIIQGGFDDGNYWIYGTDSEVGEILGKLGARFASATTGVATNATGNASNLSVSYEQADLLADADNIIYYTNNDGSPANNIDKLFALPTFQKLPGAQKGHLIGTADFLPGSYSDAIGVVGTIGNALKTEK